MFKRILVPVDPARPFHAANQYAVDLAHRFESRIVATYVIDEQLLGPQGLQTAAAMDQALEWVGREAIDDFAAHHTDLDIHKVISYGATATTLFQTVLQTGVDTVVLGGFHGGEGTHVWGSIVGEIVHHAERPAFVVRKPAKLPEPGQRIVVPYDGTGYPLHCLPRIVGFANAMQAVIDLVYVARPRDQEMAEAILSQGKQATEKLGGTVETHVLRAGLLRSKARTVLDHARASKSPLIAISRLGSASIHTGHSRTVGWLVAHSAVPIWVVRK